MQLLGAGHGFVGNVYPLLRGAALLDVSRREALYARCTKTLQTTAIFENGEANWPPNIDTPQPGPTKKLMQWCHGAPGVITALAADYPHGQSADMDAMLLAGGEAVWTAGPVSKGYGLCHGTAGNGYAFLKLFKRTANALWLDRARAFAMHAMAQRDAMHRRHGVGRYNLWTGDLGLAVYLWHCVAGKDGMPVLESLIELRLPVRMCGSAQRGYAPGLVHNGAQATAHASSLHQESTPHTGLTTPRTIVRARRIRRGCDVCSQREV